jgi:hypothetical protein
MTARALVTAAVILTAAAALASCGGASNQPTAQERDLGPASTKILGGTADTRYLHVFSASISITAPGAPRFSATLLYVGTGSDQLIRVVTPLGDASLTQSLTTDSAVPISVPLHVPGNVAVAARAGSTVSVSVRLADHGTVGLTVPIVGPTSTPTATAAS